jgi:ssDNA-binding Zn-finger/Zn-ribbon topoisomerase 1
MGVIIKGQCPKCGYQTKNLYFGSGRVDFQYCCNYPVLIKTKKSIELRNIMRKDEVLAEDPNILFYDDRNLNANESGQTEHQIKWGDYKLRADGNYCPNCSSFNLEFNVDGHWD